MYGNKIRTIRELRGFSQETLASMIGIEQNTFSRIETNQTKLSTEMLEKIAKALGVSPMDIISSEPTVVNFASNQGTQGIGHVEHLYTFQREWVEKIMTSKDDEIASLKKIIEGLLKDKEQMQQLFDKVLKK